MSQRLILFYLLFNTIFLFIPKSYSQVKVKEYSESFKTYDFGDPNPTPIFLSNTKIYPYFSFDGYSTSPSQKNYKIEATPTVIINDKKYSGKVDYLKFKKEIEKNLKKYE